MSIDLDDEILQDFLVEAGEILESLGEQLVELENSPQDRELLNAVFRGFHTIKGGAGFLNIEPMVDACHVSEDVFNVLRQGERQVSAPLMDAVLQALDAINAMFASIQGGEDPAPAEPALLATLRKYAVPESEDEVPPAAPPASGKAEEVKVANEPVSSGGDKEAKGDITDQEFEALLDAMEEGASPEAPADSDQPPSEPSTSSDEITDDEFENLLDQLHGKGKHGGLPPGKPKVEPSAQGGDSELISDDEFERLMDELHGAGKGPTMSKPETPASPQKPSQPAPKPEPAAKPAPVAAAAPAAKKESASAASSRTETTVRVDTERLDEIMNLVGEMVLVRNRLSKLKSNMGEGQVSKAIANLDMVTTDLQAAVMKTRMQPIKKVFGRFPRVVRDLARSLNKEIRLELRGEETDLDKNLVEALADPLVHLVRNSVDHGIEMPDVREKCGKSREGVVILAAEQEGDHILLSITDDGAGMDPDKLRSIAVKKGLMDAESAGRLDDKECFNLIFMAGFSTKEQISDISGRGVGMDVVKNRITQLNGTLDIDSELGKGTRLSIKVPLTLAILPTLMVNLGERTFALPLSIVCEIFEEESRRANVVDGRQVIMVRERAVPVFYLTKWLLKPAEQAEKKKSSGQVVIVQLGNQTIGLVVDQVIGQEEVVIKPLGALLHNTPGLAGSTITGDGGIALILDVPSLLKARVAQGYR